MNKIVFFPDKKLKNKIENKIENHLKNNKKYRLVTVSVNFSFVTKDTNLVCQRNIENIIKDGCLSEVIIQKLNVKGISLKNVIKNYWEGKKENLVLLLQLNQLKKDQD